METPENTTEQIDVLNKIESNVAMKSNDEIELLIKETEDTLQALMSELKRRQNDELHKDIDNLEEYLKNADTSFKSLKDFIAMALKEIRG